MEQLPLWRRYVNAPRKQPAPLVRTVSPQELRRQVHRLARSCDGRVWLLADENTARAVPELVDVLDPSFGTVLGGCPPVVPEIEQALQVAQAARAAGSRMILVAGGGTLTDLGKFAAQEAGLPLLSIPTAASVDAFTSAKSALRINGYHRTPWSRVPDIVLVCPEVLEVAPRELLLAGIGDLVAKLIARIDWPLAAMVTGEALEERESWWSAQASRRTLARFRRAPSTCAIAAMDALLVTGRAMVLAGGSRPAASSEHTMAHLWEVALHDREMLHGALVASAADIVIRAYRWIIGRFSRGRQLPASPGERKVLAARALKFEASWEERVPEELRPYLGKMREESGGRGLTPAVVERRLERMVDQASEIATRVRQGLDEAERALEALHEHGGEAAFPRIPARWQRLSVEWVRYLRNRYSLFDAAFELGWEPELLDALLPEPASGTLPTTR